MLPRAPQRGKLPPPPISLGRPLYGKKKKGIPAVVLLSSSKKMIGWNDTESMTGREQNWKDFTFLARVGLTVLFRGATFADALATKRLMATSAVVREKSMVVVFFWLE